MRVLGEVRISELRLDTEADHASLVGEEITTTLNIKSAKKLGFEEEARINCKADAEGVIIAYSNSHGLCYEVRHANGKTAWYDPSELFLPIKVYR